MLDLTEYKEYCVANEEFIYMLKDNSSIVYERLRDFFKVLGYIDMLTDTYGNIEEEYEVFYETGFPFLYKQLEETKIYYKNYFNSNYEEFSKYESIINYALYLDDLKDTLKEEELINDDIVKAINEVAEQLDLILSNKLNFGEEDFVRFNATISSEIRFKRRIMTMTEVFERIVEELDI